MILSLIILGIVVLAKEVAIAGKCQVPATFTDKPSLQNENKTFSFIPSNFLDPNRSVPLYGSILEHAPAGSEFSILIPEPSSLPNCPGLGFRVSLRPNIKTQTPDPQRPNEVSITQDIVSRVNNFKTKEEGLVYISVPHNCHHNKKVEIILFVKDCTFKAPGFNLGKTNKTEWNNSIRKRKTPYGEVGAQGTFFFTIRSETLKQIDGDELEDALEDYKKLYDAFYDITGKKRSSQISLRAVTDNLSDDGLSYPAIINIGVEHQMLRRGFLKTANGKRVARVIAQGFVKSSDDVDEVVNEAYSRIGI